MPLSGFHLLFKNAPPKTGGSVASGAAARKAWLSRQRGEKKAGGSGGGTHHSSPGVPRQEPEYVTVARKLFGSSTADFIAERGGRVDYEADITPVTSGKGAFTYSQDKSAGVFSKNDDTGKVSEAIAQAVIADVFKIPGATKVVPKRGKTGGEANNAEVDMLADHLLFEVKGGSVGNGDKSRDSRVKVGRISKTEEGMRDSWIKSGQGDKWAGYLEAKRNDALARKFALAEHASKRMGKKVDVREMVVLMNPRTGKADVYLFAKPELSISWRDARIAGEKKDGRGKAYIGTYSYTVRDRATKKPIPVVDVGDQPHLQQLRRRKKR